MPRLEKIPYLGQIRIAIERESKKSADAKKAFRQLVLKYQLSDYYDILQQAYKIIQQENFNFQTLESFLFSLESIDLNSKRIEEVKQKLILKIAKFNRGLDNYYQGGDKDELFETFQELIASFEILIFRKIPLDELTKFFDQEASNKPLKLQKQQ